MRNLVDRFSIRLARMMANPEGEGAQRHRAIRMPDRHEHRAEATIWPRHVCLDAAAEHCAVLTLVVACLEPRLRNAALPPQLFAECLQRLYGTS